MPRDLQQVMRRTEMLLEASKELCDSSARAIQRSHRLLEKIEASRAGANGEAYKRGPVTALPVPVAPVYEERR